MKAVIIKGPQPDSRSFITLLPESMDALLLKARDLFTVPPNHTPHFTLGDDVNVIVLPDFLPLIREREVLIFRWSPDTPRSSLRRSMGQPVAVVPIVEQVAVSPSIDDGNKDESNKAARGVRWDESVVCNEERNKRQIPRSKSQKETRDSVASRQRAEYVKQKIQEQEELQRREDQAQLVASAGAAAVATIASDDPFVTSIPVEASTNNANVSLPEITKEDLMASGSSPPGYSSPKPKLTGTAEEEQQTSSPLASPTRDVRSARKTDHSMAWMMGLGAEKQQQPADQEEAEADRENNIQGAIAEERLDETVGDEAKEVVADPINLTAEEVVAPEEATVDTPMQQTLSTATDTNELEEEQAVEQATSPIRRQEVNVKDVPAYQTMKSVVNQLRSHPSNQWFRQPCQEDLQRFCQERNRPVVDLFTISNAITLGEYGLDEPLKHFHTDLDQMWNNIRTFYPPQSQQSHCASMLETFSGILLEEWKRNTNAANRAAAKARPLKPRPHSTPISRGEKHHMKPNQDSTPKTQQQAYFASLVAKAGLAASRSPSGTQASRTGPSLKRPALLPAPRMDRPVKKAQVSPPAAAVPVLTVTNDNAAITTTTSKANEKAPRLMTRQLAKQSAA